MAYQDPTPHVPRLRFGDADRITLGGVHYFRPESDEKGHILRRLDNPDLVESFTHEQVWELSKRPDYDHSEDFFSPERARARNATGVDRLEQLSSRELPMTMWKFEIAIRVFRMLESGKVERTEEGTEEAITLAHEAVSKLGIGQTEVKPTGIRRKKKKLPGKRGTYGGTPVQYIPRLPPKLRTVRGWLRLLETRGYCPSVLRDGRYRSGRTAPRIIGESFRLLVEYGDKYASPGRPSISRLHLDLREAVNAYNKGKPRKEKIACPSRRALGRYILSLGRFYVYSKRYDLDKAKAKFAIVTQGPDVVRPYQRLEMDSYDVDLQSILTELGIWEHLDDVVRSEVGRMVLCLIVDAATRCIVGMTLSKTATTEAALATLRMAVSDKGPFADAVGALTPWDMVSGLNLVVTDAGSQFGKEFTSAITWLGGSHDIPPGGNPGLRGRVERLFETIHTLLLARFHGRTFSNVVEKGDYPAERLANMQTPDIAYAMVRWAVDAYHNRPHDGLAGETPRNAWIRLNKLFHVKPPPSRDRLRHVFGISLAPTLGNEGLRVLGLYYWCEALEKHFVDRGFVEMEVKADPADLGSISVRIGDAWHVATCVRPGFNDVSMDTWIRAVADLRRVHADQAEITEDIMFEALRAIDGVRKAAEARAGIGAVGITSADVARAERELMLGFNLPDQRPVTEQGDPGDLLAGGFSVKGPEGPSGDDPIVPPPSPDDVTFED
ncbi:hypothetical protein [Methylobacterium sp.]|uniref:hypothetical protein n=1 Tax=Methylobacterium sp. TaxID=409 RepID=UPI003B015FF7